MTRFSARLALPLGLLLAIFLVPIWYGRLAPERDECPSKEAILVAEEADPRLEIVRRGPKSTNVESGQLLALLPDDGHGLGPMAIAIYRSFGLPNRLLQPASALPGRREPDEVRLEMVATKQGDLPIHYAYEQHGRNSRVTAYLMGYRGEAIRSPLWTRLSQGPGDLFTGRWPITLFVVAGRAHPSKLQERLDQMETWLVEAWERYQQVCVAASGPEISDSAALPSAGDEPPDRILAGPLRPSPGNHP